MVSGGCGPPSYRGRAFFRACQLARGGFFRHHFAFPDRWNIDLRQTLDYCNISSHFDNSLFRLPGGLHSKCSERCQTNYGSDFLFRILQFWFQNLLALVTRYLESTFCPRFACIPGSLKCERGARAPGRPRHNMDHISTQQHALFSPPPPSSSSRLINRIKRDLSSLAAGRHSLGTIVGWIEVTSQERQRRRKRSREVSSSWMNNLSSSARGCKWDANFKKGELQHRPTTKFNFWTTLRNVDCTPILTGVNKRFYNSCKTLLRGNWPENLFCFFPNLTKDFCPHSPL